MTFFVGLHQPSDAQHFEHSFISVHRLRQRKSQFKVRKWILDSGAFSTISLHGGYPNPVEDYGAEITRWANCGQLLAAVAQDYMCEPGMLRMTGLTINEHQRLTIKRYDALLRCETPVYVMPVLQGYAPDDYVRHIREYGPRLKRNMWVGVGSVCKRNGNPKAIIDVLLAIKSERPDLGLHGFGLKTTALRNGTIRRMLLTADSMSWSFAARKEGRNANDYREAQRFEALVNIRREYQAHLAELWLGVSA